MSANSPLEKYRIKSSSERWSSQYETEEWVLVYIIPEDKRDTLKPHYKVSIDNILPGHDTTDPYAPCINESGPMALSEAYPGHYELPIVYRRPGMNVLKPGQGVLANSSSHEVLVTKEEPRSYWRDLSARKGAITIIYNYPAIISHLKHTIVENHYRQIYNFAAVESVDSIRTLLTRKKNWEGYTGSFTYGGVTLDNLKCAKIEISPRGGNLSRLDVQYRFIQRDDGWPVDGGPLVSYSWAFFDRGYQYMSSVAGERLPPKGERPEGFGAAIRLEEREQEFSKGAVSRSCPFSRMESYFTWMSGG